MHVTVQVSSCYHVVNKCKAKYLTDYVKSCNSLCLLAYAAQNKLDALI